MGIIFEINSVDDLADEVVRQYREGLDYKAYMKKISREYKEKAQTLTAKQENEHVKNINSIISDSQGLDNGLVYNLATGEVEKEI